MVLKSEIKNAEIINSVHKMMSQCDSLKQACDKVNISYRTYYNAKGYFKTKELQKSTKKQYALINKPVIYEQDDENGERIIKLPVKIMKTMQPLKNKKNVQKNDHMDIIDSCLEKFSKIQ
jgi:hypothetical protein